MLRSQWRSGLFDQVGTTAGNLLWR